MPAWDADHAIVREKRLTLGRQFTVESPEGVLRAYCKQKMFRLKEDIRFWTGQDMQQPLFRLQARKVLDFRGAFDLQDETGATIAQFRRRGWRSLFRPEWGLYNAQGEEVGKLEVDSGWMVWLRRNVPLGPVLFPSSYHVRLDTGQGPQEVASITERRQMWGNTYDVRRTPGATIDLRVPVALAVLVDAFEEVNEG